MLNWCKNHSVPDKQSEIYVFPAPSQPHQHSTHTIAPPKFTTQSHKPIRRLKPNPKHNGKTDVSQSVTFDKCVQVAMGVERRPMVDSGTQTTRLTLEIARERACASGVQSRQMSPRTLLNNRSYLNVEYGSRQDQFGQSRKQSFDQQIESNIKTRATHCLAETKDQVERCDKSKLWGVMGIESYHIQPPTTRQLDPLPATPTRSIHFKDSVIRQLPSHSHHTPHSPNSPNSHQTPHSPHSTHSHLQPRSHNARSISNRYRQIYRNVQTEFKMSQQRSQKRRSERKLKFPPDNRLLFERQTIMSYTDEHRTQSKEMLVEESIIMERESRSLFTAVSSTLYYEYFSTYLALENVAGVLVSIKEIPITYMDRIPQELLIYKELQASSKEGNHLDGVLSLFQTQIDFNSYLLIKEPYTLSLKAHITHCNDLSDILAQLQTILHQMQTQGYQLQQPLHLSDLVIVVDQVKIQNPGIFSLESQDKAVCIDQCILQLRSQMLELIN